MKNNIILKSTDRELFGIKISQSTKDHFLSITDLQKAYEIARWQHGWVDRKVDAIMQTNDFKERVFYILENQGLIKLSIVGFMEMVNNEGIAKVLKGLGVYKTTGARTTKQTFAAPHIWILLAMELNPMIYAKVILFLTDTLIFDRLEAGSEYMPMNSAIKSVVTNPDYPSFAKSINLRVFGSHLTGMRNLASAKELRAIADIEKFVISCISQKFISTPEAIINAISNYGK